MGEVIRRGGLGAAFKKSVRDTIYGSSVPKLDLADKKTWKFYRSSEVLKKYEEYLKTVETSKNRVFREIDKQHSLIQTYKFAEKSYENEKRNILSEMKKDYSGRPNPEYLKRAALQLKSITKTQAIERDKQFIAKLKILEYRPLLTDLDVAARALENETEDLKDELDEGTWTGICHDMSVSCIDGVYNALKRTQEITNMNGRDLVKMSRHKTKRYEENRNVIQRLENMNPDDVEQQIGEFMEFMNEENDPILNEAYEYISATNISDEKNPDKSKVAETEGYDAPEKVDWTERDKPEAEWKVKKRKGKDQ